MMKIFKIIWNTIIKWFRKLSTLLKMTKIDNKFFKVMVNLKFKPRLEQKLASLLNKYKGYSLVITKLESFLIYFVRYGFSTKEISSILSTLTTKELKDPNKLVDLICDKLVKLYDEKF